MRKKNYRSYLVLGLILLALFYLPRGFVQGVRASSAGMSGSVWKQGRGSSKKVVFEKLQAENLLLKKQNELLRQLLHEDDRIDHLIKKIQTFTSFNEKAVKAFYERRRDAAKKLLNLELFSIQARVIYRSPAHWNSTLWINVGEKTNQALGQTVVAPGSPILKGEDLIGVIEEVQPSKSLVRLLTDSSLIPSVRVARDKEKKYLAKGELHGSGSPLWRGRSDVVKGIGFNYDFDDEEGFALELRSGKPLDQLSKDENLRLIDVGDLLVTTGMDGIFPMDLPVATVSKVATLKEGAVSFEIRAKLCAGNLDSLIDVTVLPPLEVSP